MIHDLLLELPETKATPLWSYGLVVEVFGEKDGRDRRLYFNAMPIQMVYDRWTTEYSSFWASRLMDIKYRVESAASGGTRGSGSKKKSKTTKRSHKKGKDTT